MRTIQSLLLSSILAGLACSAASAATDDGQWRGTTGISMSLSSGNTTSRNILINGDTASKTANSKTSFGGYINKATANGVSNSNRWGTVGEYDYNLTTSLYGFGRLGFEADKIKHLKLRTSVGAGMGYHVINTPSTTFDVYGGLGLSKDKYDLAQTIGSKTDTRFSRTELMLGEASEHKITDSVNFKQKFELFNGITGDKAKRTQLSAGLDVSMSKNMTLNVGLMQTHNNTVAAGTKKNDSQLFTGVSYKLGQ
jgi:putative salt-induced outer membrane protein